MLSWFTGGNKLQAHLRKVTLSVGRNPTVRVGFPRGKTYPNGMPVAEVAAIQNYGSAKTTGMRKKIRRFIFGGRSVAIPARPFFSNMVRNNRASWGPLLAQYMRGHSTPEAMKLLGQTMAEQLRQSIHDTNAPPLALSTALRKGNNKPLIDTGTMIDSVESGVE